MATHNVLANRTIQNIQERIQIRYNHKQIKLDKYNILYLNINSLRNKLNDLELTIHNIQINNGKIIHCIDGDKNI